MKFAFVGKAQPAKGGKAIPDKIVQREQGEGCFEKMKKFVEDLLGNPPSGCWNQVSSISEPVLDGNFVSVDFWVDGKFTGYNVQWGESRPVRVRRDT